MCPDRGRRRAMLTEGSKQMVPKVSDLLVLTTSPCVDTGDVGCFRPLFLMPYCWCGTTFHMAMRMGEFLDVRPTMCARAIRLLWS